MTAYIAIADSEVDTDSPITESLLTRLRSNPLAMFEKATGAPVLANDYVVTAMVIDEAVNHRKVTWNTAGTEIVSKWQGAALQAVGVHPTFTKMIECRVGTYGTVRVSRTHDNSTMYTQIYVDGIAAASAQTGAGQKTDDVTVNGGSLVQIYGNCSSDGCTGDTISDVWIGVTSGLGVIGDWN